MTIGLSAVCDFCERTDHADDDTTRDAFITQLRNLGWHVDTDTTPAATLCPTCTRTEDLIHDLPPRIPTQTREDDA